MSDTQIQTYAPPRKSTASSPARVVSENLPSASAGREGPSAPGPVPALDRAVLISKHGKPVMGTGGRQMRLMLGKRRRQK